MSGEPKYSNTPDKSVPHKNNEEAQVSDDQLDDHKEGNNHKKSNDKSTIILYFNIITQYYSKKKDASQHNNSDYVTQEQYSSRYIEDKGSLFGDSEVSQYAKNQKYSSPEVIAISRNVRGKVVGFENVFFKDSVNNARSRSHSPDELKNVLLPDEITDSDFDFDQKGY